MKAAISHWVTTGEMSIKKMNIGRTKEKTEAVPARFRPCLKAAGLTIGSGKKNGMAIAWKAGSGVVPCDYIGRIGLSIRRNSGRTM
jgi:hypothetical protein